MNQKGLFSETLFLIVLFVITSATYSTVGQQQENTTLSVYKYYDTTNRWQNAVYVTEAVYTQKLLHDCPGLTEIKVRQLFGRTIQDMQGGIPTLGCEEPTITTATLENNTTFSLQYELCCYYPRNNARSPEATYCHAASLHKRVEVNGNNCRITDLQSGIIEDSRAP